MRSSKPVHSNSLLNLLQLTGISQAQDRLRLCICCYAACQGWYVLLGAELGVGVGLEDGTQVIADKCRLEKRVRVASF